MAGVESSSREEASVLAVDDGEDRKHNGKRIVGRRKRSELVVGCNYESERASSESRDLHTILLAVAYWFLVRLNDSRLLMSPPLRIFVAGESQDF